VDEDGFLDVTDVLTIDPADATAPNYFDLKKSEG
jgi:hypothetical protein